ncbi:amino acid-binding protein [Kordiimonas sediminis]|uniref:Amino acid-binding protein n=1 Tax=Kordiimonas sediminis TaxID=1735581 RepID=A0A919E9I2_9PROT|nr:ACT domain-containing protein [Kordiimonas sediminis]GHF26216.1 amino acid-binding protein [Kordiimonas sediminis]
MSHSKSAVLISISGLDRVGVVSEVSGYLFEIGGNLADTAFALLGKGFDYTAVAEFDVEISTNEISDGLASLNSLQGAEISVKPFPFDLAREHTGTITHFLEIIGGDKPGLVARVSEVILEYGANIVRMTSRRVETEDGYDYRTRFGLNISGGNAEALENALYNTAGSMRLTCEFKKAAG